MRLRLKHCLISSLTSSALQMVLLTLPPHLSYPKNNASSLSLPSSISGKKGMLLTGSGQKCFGGENIIGSHVFYNVRLEETPKVGIVSWGYRDRVKEYLRGYAPSVHLEVLHLLFSIAAEFKWPIGQMDIEFVFLQAL